MRKRLQIALALFLVSIAGVIAWQALRPREPVYGGKPLSVWLKSFDLDVPKAEVDVASDAVRQIGTQSLPMLLEMISSEDRDSTWNKRRWPETGPNAPT